MHCCWARRGWCFLSSQTSSRWRIVEFGIGYFSDLAESMSTLTTLHQFLTKKEQPWSPHSRRGYLWSPHHQLRQHDSWHLLMSLNGTTATGAVHGSLSYWKHRTQVPVQKTKPHLKLNQPQARHQLTTSLSDSPSCLALSTSSLSTHSDYSSCSLHLHRSMSLTEAISSRPAEYMSTPRDSLDLPQDRHSFDLGYYFYLDSLRW